MHAEIRAVAKAIAENGFGRDWDDFPIMSIEETDQGDLEEYAIAAINEVSRLGLLREPVILTIEDAS